MSVVSLLLEWRGKRQGQSCGYTGASPTRVLERSIAVPTGPDPVTCPQAGQRLYRALRRSHPLVELVISHHHHHGHTRKSGY